MQSLQPPNWAPKPSKQRTLNNKLGGKKNSSKCKILETQKHVNFSQKLTKQQDTHFKGRQIHRSQIWGYFELIEETHIPKNKKQVKISGKNLRGREMRSYSWGKICMFKNRSPREDCNRGLELRNAVLSKSSKKEMGEEGKSGKNNTHQTNPFHPWFEHHFSLPFHCPPLDFSNYRAKLKEGEEEEEEGEEGEEGEAVEE